MYHSVTFGEKNTWDDWHLIPTSRPIFNPPELKTRYIDIPGSSGIIDLTESLTGYPTFNNRTGSMTFVVDYDFKPWYQLYSEILDYLHGKRLKAVLEDDREWFYEGRFTLSEWDSKSPVASRSTITIDYNVAPFKWSVESSMDDWKWDPFNFYTGIIRSAKFKNVILNDPVVWIDNELSIDVIGRAPANPIFIVKSTDGKGITVRFVNPEFGIDDTRVLPDGRTQVFEWEFTGSPCTISYKGVGSISIDFRVGRL